MNPVEHQIQSLSMNNFSPSETFNRLFLGSDIKFTSNIIFDSGKGIIYKGINFKDGKNSINISSRNGILIFHNISSVHSYSPVKFELVNELINLDSIINFSIISQSTSENSCFIFKSKVIEKGKCFIILFNPTDSETGNNCKVEIFFSIIN